MTQLRDRTNEIRRCRDELKEALNEGKMGDIVGKIEELIFHYYEDVQDQAKQSFRTAKFAAIIGFTVLIGTLLYALTFDALSRFGKTADTSLMVARIGLVSGALIEFTAGVTFWLYSRGARQFGAFHICLERTHRYLIAYKIAEQVEDRKDETLRDLVCIMANAPMITRDDIDSPDARAGAREGRHDKVIPAERKKV